MTSNNIYIYIYIYQKRFIFLKLLANFMKDNNLFSRNCEDIRTQYFIDKCSSSSNYAEPIVDTQSIIYHKCYL